MSELCSPSIYPGECLGELLDVLHFCQQIGG